MHTYRLHLRKPQNQMFLILFSFDAGSQDPGQVIFICFLDRAGSCREGIRNWSLNLDYHELCTQGFRRGMAGTVAHGVNFILTLLIILNYKMISPSLRLPIID